MYSSNNESRNSWEKRLLIGNNSEKLKYVIDTAIRQSYNVSTQNTRLQINANLLCHWQNNYYNSLSMKFNHKCVNL